MDNQHEDKYRQIKLEYPKVILEMSGYELEGSSQIDFVRAKAPALAYIRLHLKEPNVTECQAFPIFIQWNEYEIVITHLTSEHKTEFTYYLGPAGLFGYHPPLAYFYQVFKYFNIYDKLKEKWPLDF